MATENYIQSVEAVDIRELEKRLRQYIRRVRAGEQILVSDEGQVVASLSAVEPPLAMSNYSPGILEMARRGEIRLAKVKNDPSIYRRQREGANVSLETVLGVLDELRGER